MWSMSFFIEPSTWRHCYQEPSTWIHNMFILTTVFRIEWWEQRNWVCFTKSKGIMLIALQPAEVNRWHFKFFWSNRDQSLNYRKSKTFSFNDIEIRKSEFVAKTQFLHWILRISYSTQFNYFLHLLNLVHQILIKY